MADETLTPAASASPARSLGWKGVVFGVSLSRVQAIVGTVAGVVSIAGAFCSMMPFAPSPGTGELVATVQDAASQRRVTDATIEVLTTKNEIVATLSPDGTGRAAQDLKAGIYVVRVSHPRYAADVRRVQVLARHTVEIRANLRAGSSSPVQAAINDGVRAVRRALRF
jgi:hypothetical protein